MKTDAVDVVGFVRRWWELFGSKPVRSRDLIGLFLMDPGAETALGALRECGQAINFGKFLTGELVGGRVGDLVCVLSGKDHNAILYRLMQVPVKSPRIIESRGHRTILGQISPHIRRLDT